jgi:hypothetical protein
MTESTINRRRFLVAAIAFSGVALAGSGSSFLRISQAWAGAGNKPGQSTLDAMVRMARLLYPHEALADEVYAQVIDEALTSIAGDSSFAETLAEAEHNLNAGQTSRFVDLDAESQTTALEAVQQEPFFTTIQGTVMLGLYYHPKVWELLGYEGPSYQYGGYLNRGAGEINWLPGSES